MQFVDCANSVMKNKIVKIILIVAGIAIPIVAGVGIYIYNFTQKSEKISGKKETIPLKSKAIESITRGSSDWSSWQGQNFDKKSSFTGIVKDWSKGLKKEWEGDIQRRR